MKNLSDKKSYKITRLKQGFTLAEVLITLGIIGVVAALTIPTLIANHRKSVVETRLAKFYSTMNQAILRAEIDFGDKKDWGNIGDGYEKDENGNPDKTKSIPLEWFNTYMRPYLNLMDVKLASDGRVLAYFPDGSLAAISSAAIIFYIDAKYYSEYENDNGKFPDEMQSGTKCFLFAFWPSSENNKFHYNKGVEPYISSNWDGKRESLFTGEYGCKKDTNRTRPYCTKLIQMNGWKIPKDYPLRI